jgi:hypothetical protein
MGLAYVNVDVALALVAVAQIALRIEQRPNDRLPSLDQELRAACSELRRALAPRDGSA